MAYLTLRNINKIYPNGFHAVHDFNLEAEKGEFIVFVGPSGCGKSTTLRMIAGLEDISKGDFLIDGKLANNLGPREREIAMVFQSYALYPNMTVYDNLAFGLNLQGVDEDIIEERVQKTAKILGLTDYLDRMPRALSGGQRQRVALGRAIVREPAVFLFDEPLSNLDAKMRVEMRAEIIRLHNRLGATMIYVTHDQTEAMTMGERIVVMNEGRVQQVARPLDLYERPANEFVAGFIGTPPMNIFPAGVFSGRRTGLRPEHIAIADDGSGGLEAEVDFVESLGSETLVHAVFRGVPTVVRLPGFAGHRPGEKIYLRPDTGKMVEFT